MTDSIYREETLGLKGRHRRRWKVGQILFRVYFSNSTELFQLYTVSTLSTSKRRFSPTGRANIHQHAASWERVLAGCHSRWGHRRFIESVPRHTRHHAPAPDYSSLDWRFCACWRSEISTIQYRIQISDGNSWEKAKRPAWRSEPERWIRVTVERVKPWLDL